MDKLSKQYNLECGEFNETIDLNGKQIQYYKIHFK